CSSVLLPEPEGPMIATNSPSSTRTSTPRSACTAPGPWPKTLTSPTASRAAEELSFDVMAPPYVGVWPAPSAGVPTPGSGNYAAPEARAPVARRGARCRVRAGGEAWVLHERRATCGCGPGAGGRQRLLRDRRVRGGDRAPQRTGAACRGRERGGARRLAAHG